MKKILIILNYLSDKTGIRSDLIAHFGLCFTLSLIGGWYGATFAAGWGIGKEHGDHNSPVNKWDWLDILADGIGIALGLTIRHFI